MLAATDLTLLAILVLLSSKSLDSLSWARAKACSKSFFRRSQRG
jgi:hypothetical protein